MALEVAGGAFHSALFQTLLEKMASSEVINFCSKKKVNRGLLQKLKILLLSANAVLDDPEEKQLRNQFVRKCLHELKEATYDAEDLMAEICEENLQSEIEGESDSSSSFKRMKQINRALLFSKTVFAKVVEPKIEWILDGLQFILEQKHVLGLKESVQNRPLSRRSPATSVVEESGH